MAEEERISVEELEKILKELDKEEKEKQCKDLVVAIPEVSGSSVSVSTAVSVSEEHKEPSFAELAKKLEEIAERLEVVEKAMTKGICYHVKLPFKDEEYATVCRRHFADAYHLHAIDERVVGLLVDLLFKYYKHAVTAYQAIDELEECDSYPPHYHVVMFTDPVRLAVLYANCADLTYIFRLENDVAEIVRVTVDLDGGNKPRLRSVCRATDTHGIEAIRASLLEALDMPLKEEG